jgi:diaminopimelate decarboxylase
VTTAPDLSLLPPSAEVDGGDLRIGGRSLRELAREFGTPAYVIDERALRARAREYVRALTSRHPHGQVCFAAKAYPSASIIRAVAEEGLGCDVVGGGELRIALAAGLEPAKIVMHGNAKTDDDIQAALDARIGYIVVDGFDEIDRLARLARERTPVLLRVNPAIDAPTHAAMATGGAGAKFGVPFEQVPEAIARLRALPAIDLRGLHVHIGSQILELEQFEAAVTILSRLERFPVYDFGGGLGARYVPEEAAPSVDRYCELLVAAAHRQLGDAIEILIEPGRSVVAQAGVTLYRVITPDVWLADPQVGDLVVLPVTGAYCFTMSNNYNAALRPPVVLCADGEARLAVRRETYADLFAREIALPVPSTTAPPS